MKVVPVAVWVKSASEQKRASPDNYAYLLIDETTNEAGVIDPLDMKLVNQAAKDNNVKLVACLTTHHHPDHSGGNEDFAEQYPEAKIYNWDPQSHGSKIKDKEEFSIGENRNISVKCLATPCHTQDSICYYATDQSNPQEAGAVFTGDTLFIAGCGRFFEGTAAQMHAALTYLGTLPDSTVVYTGHEYTAGNLAFASTVEPDNKALGKLRTLVDQADQNPENKSTQGKSTIGDEKEWNVFMRLGSDAVMKETGATNEIEVMDKLREGKNNFRG
jgi:hydroxyacylglutathione hydrolase